MSDIVLGAPRPIADAVKYAPVQRQATICRIVKYTNSESSLVVNYVWVDADGEFSPATMILTGEDYVAVNEYLIQAIDNGSEFFSVAEKLIVDVVKNNLGIT